MKYSIFLIFFILSYSFAFADSRSGPERVASSSPDGEYLVRVHSPIKNPKALAAATLFRFSMGKYKKEISFDLLDGDYPTFVLVTDKGTIFTFDNHPLSLGRGNVVSIYSSSGTLIKSYKLEDLFHGEDLESIYYNRSVSNIWWRCIDSKPWANYYHVFVRDTIGGQFTFNSESGTFEYKNEGGCTWPP